MMIVYILAATAWWASGAASVAYWWTKDSDLTGGEIPLVIIAGALGPIAFLAGWSIHGEPLLVCSRVWIKKRQRE